MSLLKIRTKLTPGPNNSTERHCVLIGHNGHGKTALKNKLCGTSHTSQPAGSSVTRNLFKNPVSVGMGTFSIIDTPGIGSSQEVFKHAWLNYKALTTFGLNTVFIIAKYENRYTDICTNIDKAIGLFDNDLRSNQEYARNIVVLISHFDQAKHPAKEFEDICGYLNQYNVFNVVAYSVNHDLELLANTLYACVSNMDKIRITMTWELFFANFPFNHQSEVREIRKNFTQAENAISNILTCMLSMVTSEIQSIPSEDKDEWLQSLIVSHREICQDTLDDFNMRNANSMEELDLYAAHIELQQKIMKQEERLVQAIKPFMTYDISDPKHPKNLIKKCPHCGLVWWKVAGCNGETTCGNRSWGQNESESALLKGSQLFKFVFTWSDNNKRKMTFQRKSRNVLSNIQNTFSSNAHQEAAKNARAQGCGKTFIWSELPPLPENEWQAIMRITTIDSVKKIIEQDMGPQFREYRQNVDDNFYM